MAEVGSFLLDVKRPPILRPRVKASNASRLPATGYNFRLLIRWLSFLLLQTLSLISVELQPNPT